MKETNFIDQNKKKWKELEELLQEDRKDPDKLSNLFIQVSDDLSYARTFYPNRFVRLYLNNYFIFYIKINPQTDQVFFVSGKKNFLTLCIQHGKNFFLVSAFFLSQLQLVFFLFAMILLLRI